MDRAERILRRLRQKMVQGLSHTTEQDVLKRRKTQAKNLVDVVPAERGVIGAIVVQKMRCQR